MREIHILQTTMSQFSHLWLFAIFICDFKVLLNERDEIFLGWRKCRYVVLAGISHNQFVFESKSKSARIYLMINIFNRNLDTFRQHISSMNLHFQTKICVKFKIMLELTPTRENENVTVQFLYSEYTVA